MVSPFVIACQSLALVVVVLAFVREVRMRCALQRLLSRLLARWRTLDETIHSPTRSGRIPPNSLD